MALQIDIEGQENKAFISAFGNNYIKVDNKKLFNLIIYDGEKITSYEKIEDIFDKNIVKNFKDLVISREIELILLGTGTHCLKPPLELKEFWLQNKVSFEIMNSFSAYKTYNILLSEKRRFISLIKLV
ncbi:MAG: hypothetical protein CMP36_03505 [Rickettsiales bacterium]|nr:hypothetical protein [Rickettsiales bacterium]OUV79020.1 MAG: hypothetical protein CBC91_04185 [Rickettsiales bacterium TMED131]